MVDLQGQYQRIKPEITAAIDRVLESTAFIQGDEVREFSGALSNFVGGSHVITCANGTDALQIAMMALDLRPGDEIILPVHTYVATAEVIALLGLKPSFVDVDPRSFNIDPDKIEERITPQTKAIVPVHLYGQCAHMERILEIAKKHNLFVIEDAAQALGAVYQFADHSRCAAGTMGVIGTTSFFPSKNLGCFGDGGAIFTNDQKHADMIRMIANHGQRVKYVHEIVGVNSRLDTLQAAILNVKIKYLEEYTKKRNWVADQYDALLKDIDFLQTPYRSSFSSHVFHQYTVIVKERSRDDLKSHLEQCGIPTMIYYPVPLHLQKAYKMQSYKEGAFPVTEGLSKTVLSLPIHTEMTADEVSYIVSMIKKF